jgi:hypothetical protein
MHSFYPVWVFKRFINLLKLHTRYSLHFGLLVLRISLGQKFDQINMRYVGVQKIGFRIFVPLVC